MSEGVDASGVRQPRVINPSQDHDEMTPTLQESNNPELRENEGLRMDFRIDNKLLIYDTLWRSTQNYFSSIENQEDFFAFQNFAMAVSEQCYGYFSGKASPEQFFASGGAEDQLNAYMSQMEQSKEFGKIRQQTEAYLEVVKTQWERNYPQTAQVAQELTGLDLNKQLTVMIMHPSLSIGAYRGNNTIAWGHHEDWNNYSTVYLWHEVLHSYLDYTDLSHALIQFIVDNELRVRLNEGETYPPYVGHKDLFPLMDKILPYWHSYLAEIPAEGSRNLLRFEKKLRTMSEFQEEPQEKDTGT